MKTQEENQEPKRVMTFEELMRYEGQKAYEKVSIKSDKKVNKDEEKIFTKEQIDNLIEELERLSKRTRNPPKESVYIEVIGVIKEKLYGSKNNKNK